MRISKVILNLVIALALLGVVNAALTFVIEPYGSRSQLAWMDYANQEELDTILVGTSYMEYNVDPAVLNEDCGYKAYNLGSPSQTIEESFMGIQTAYDDHHVKRVILGVSTGILTSSTPPNPGGAFMRNRSFYVSPMETFRATNEFLWHYGAASSANSLHLLFPWASNPVHSVKFNTLYKNVMAKITHADVAAVAEDLESGWKYIGLGHGTRDKSVNMNGSHIRNINEGVDEDEMADAALPTDSTQIDPDRARTLGEICTYCKDRDIELIVIVAPLPVHNIFDENSTYFETMGSIEAFLAEQGVTVYDFNLATSDLFESKLSDFADIHHLNVDGAQKFSHALARFLNMLEAGEDVDALFTTPQEKYATIDYLSALFATSDVDADGIHLDWRIVTGPDVDVEYRVLVKEGDAEDYHPVTEWSHDTSFTYLPEQHGKVMFHICARKVGSKADYQRFRPVEELW